jgi:hypothetical protein
MLLGAQSVMVDEKVMKQSTKRMKMNDMQGKNNSDTSNEGTTLIILLELCNALETEITPR